MVNDDFLERWGKSERAIAEFFAQKPNGKVSLRLERGTIPVLAVQAYTEAVDITPPGATCREYKVGRKGLRIDIILPDDMNTGDVLQWNSVEP